jgi:hypothetical protein
MKRQFKKYEFNTKTTAQKYIKELWVEDEEGNKSRKTYSVDSVDENGDAIQIEKPYIAHVVVLGFLPIEKAEYDEEGNVTKEAVLSDKYSVDVLWESDIESRWNTYEIEPEISSHKFA